MTYNLSTTVTGAGIKLVPHQLPLFCLSNRKSSMCLRKKENQINFCKLCFQFTCVKFTTCLSDTACLTMASQSYNLCITHPSIIYVYAHSEDQGPELFTAFFVLSSSRALYRGHPWIRFNGTVYRLVWDLT